MEKESTRAWALLSSIFDYGYIDSNIKAALAHITYRKRVAIHLLHAIGIIRVRNPRVTENSASTTAVCEPLSEWTIGTGSVMY